MLLLLVSAVIACDLMVCVVSWLLVAVIVAVIVHLHSNVLVKFHALCF